MTPSVPDEPAGIITPGFDPASYDELSFFQENAEELGIPFEQPTVERVPVQVEGPTGSDPAETGRSVSALLWGDSPPELVFLHGGAQNAHTWDSVALALKRPMLAIDLPGHGHSDGGRSGQGLAGLSVIDGMADDVAIAISALAPQARAVVGMSLGGITSIALVDRHPELVRRHVLVDITPGVTGEKSRAITDFIGGPESFESFDEILERTVQFNPGRSVSSLRRGVLHNAVQRDDGRWVWRWARHRAGGPFAAPDGESKAPDFGTLWDALERSKAPLLLIRGMRSSSVIDDADEAELRRRRPDARVEHVEDAGHSVQGDDPLKLASLLSEFVP
jgi:pimeloyl-ACP methyl ester carboxylesterase